MAEASYTVTSAAPLRDRLAYQLRVLRVIAGVEFKLKYVDSMLGYAWSLAKPLAYFGVLWVVFARLFDPGIRNFGLYLLLGIVLYMFFADTVGTMLPSIVNRGAMLRRMSFPPLVIPISVSVTAVMTFGVNLVAVAVFALFADLSPEPRWLVVVPLLVELYMFALGMGLIVATLFVRFRDVGPLWDLTAQLLLFASGVFFPITILPDWAEVTVMLVPFVQALHDIRDVVLGADSTVAEILGSDAARLVPIGIAAGVLVLGLWLYRREAPRFAERT